MSYELLIPAHAQSLVVKLKKAGYKKDRFHSNIEVKGSRYSGTTRVWVWPRPTTYDKRPFEQQAKDYHEGLCKALTDAGYYFEATSNDYSSNISYEVWQVCPKKDDYRFWGLRSDYVRVRHEDGRVTKLREHPEVKAEADRRGREAAERVRTARQTEQARQKAAETLLASLKAAGVYGFGDSTHPDYIRVSVADMTALLRRLEVPVG